MINTIKPDWVKMGRTPLKSTYLGEGNKFMVLEVDKKDAKRLVLGFNGVEFNNFNLEVKAPRGFFRRLYDPD